jgi:hypothetical protein
MVVLSSKRSRILKTFFIPPMTIRGLDIEQSSSIVLVVVLQVMKNSIDSFFFLRERIALIQGEIS